MISFLIRNRKVQIYLFVFNVQEPGKYPRFDLHDDYIEFFTCHAFSAGNGNDAMMC